MTTARLAQEKDFARSGFASGLYVSIHAMALTAEQLQVVTQVVQTGLHQYMENMKPMFEQLVVATTQGQGGQSRKFAESLSKHTDVFQNSGFEGWQFKMLTAARAISQKAHDVMEYPKSNLDTEVPDDARLILR